MSINYETKLTISEQWNKIPELVEDIVTNAGFFLRDQLVAEAPVDTGLLAGSFQYAIEDDGYTFHAWSAVKYAGFVAHGTRPHFPPWEPIDEWAHRHHLPTFPIWLGIGLRGTRANPYHQRAFEALDSNFDDIMGVILRTRGYI